MLAASPLLREAARYSQTMSLRADIWNGPTLIKPNVPVVGGDMSADRASKTRLSAKLDLAMWPWEFRGINNTTCQVALYRGVESLGRREVLPHGRYRIDDIARSPGGLVSLDCSGLESYIVNGRFVKPRTPPRNSSTVGTIAELIKEILPRVRVRNEATTNRKVLATAPWARERWDAVEYLGESISAEVFADARGDFVIRNTPSLTRGTPVLRIGEGELGLLVDTSEKQTRDRVYNAAIVNGRSSDPNVPPTFGWAYVDDPADEMYFYGEFGQVPIFYSSQFFTTNAQCSAYAVELLARAKARNGSLSFVTPPTLWYLETGDLVWVDRIDGTSEIHLLQKMDGSLDEQGGIKFDTVSTKVAVSEDA